MMCYEDMKVHTVLSRRSVSSGHNKHKKILGWPRRLPRSITFTLCRQPPSIQLTADDSHRPAGLLDSFHTCTCPARLSSICRIPRCSGFPPFNTHFDCLPYRPTLPFPTALRHLSWNNVVKVSKGEVQHSWKG